MLAFYHQRFYKKQTNKNRLASPHLLFDNCSLPSWFVWAVATQRGRCGLSMSVCLSVCQLLLHLSSVTWDEPHWISSTSSPAPHPQALSWQQLTRVWKLSWQSQRTRWVGMHSTERDVKLRGANTERFGPKILLPSVSAGQSSIATSLISRYCRSTSRIQICFLK